MADYIAKTPLAGQGPVTYGTLTLAELPVMQITSVSPQKGGDKGLAKALKTMGLSFPAPNAVSENGAARLVWTGANQAFLMGVDATPLAAYAALTDQSDGWAHFALAGPDAAEALMRLIPLDLRGWQKPQCARTQLGHMQAVVMASDGGFEVMVFRSMARTAWHEVEIAMKTLAARSEHLC